MIIIHGYKIISIRLVYPKGEQVNRRTWDTFGYATKGPRDICNWFLTWTILKGYESKILHSQYCYFIWEWRFHSITAAMGFPLRDKITGGYPIKMKYISDKKQITYILTQNGIPIQVCTCNSTVLVKSFAHFMLWTFWTPLSQGGHRKSIA